MVDTSSMRAGDADRDRTIERLRQAYTEGRLDGDEFQQRLDAATAARTYADLLPLTADLPGPAITPMQPVPPVESSATPPTPVSAAGTDVAEPGRDLRSGWAAWAGVSLICTVIWFGTWITGGSAPPFWPIWVIGPWGAVMLLTTLTRGSRR